MRPSSLTPRAGAALALVLLSAAGCARVAGLETLSVAELAALLESHAAPIVLDANVEATRNRLGTIPGARLLSSYRDYDPDAELPPDRDRPLVFYCYNPWCSAATEAARRAQAAGHARVAVMEAGIDGWRAAGLPVERRP